MINLDKYLRFTEGTVKLRKIPKSFDYETTFSFLDILVIHFTNGTENLYNQRSTEN